MWGHNLKKFPCGMFYILHSNKVKSQWPLTFNIQNLIRSSLSHSGPSCQIWTKSFKALLKITFKSMTWYWAAVILTFDLWPTKSNQIIFESLVQSLKYKHLQVIILFLQYVLEFFFCSLHDCMLLINILWSGLVIYG